MTSKVIYQGLLRTEAEHLSSKDRIITDAPLDNNGKGEAFSPTDLVATSLASCMATIMGIKANNAEINIDQITFDVEKKMGTEPRRIVQINIHIDMKRNYNEKERRLLETAAINCPVAKSIHPDIIQEVNFIYPN
jgi:uncharacterized OsmC-like protein